MCVFILRSGFIKRKFSKANLICDIETELLLLLVIMSIDGHCQRDVFKQDGLEQTVNVEIERHCNYFNVCLCVHGAKQNLVVDVFRILELNLLEKVMEKKFFFLINAS